MSEGWGAMPARRALAWKLARVVGPVEADGSDGRWGDAALALEYLDDGSPGRLRLRELGRPMGQLMAALTTKLGPRGVARHQLAAALGLIRSGVAIAVVPTPSGWAIRSPDLFAVFDADMTRLEVAPTHALPWLQAHVGKHMSAENADAFAAAIRAVAPQLGVADVKGLLRRWSGDVVDAAAWPLLEVYSLLLVASLARPGPVQALVRWRDPAGAAGPDAQAALAELSATSLSRSEVGVQSLTCATLPGLRAAAKGEQGALPMRWATLHPASATTLQQRIGWLRRTPALEVVAIES